MAAKTKMRDMIIVLPGIMGSQLQRHGVDVWAITLPALGQAITSQFKSLRELKLEGGDPLKDDIGDGVRATKWSSR